MAVSRCATAHLRFPGRPADDAAEVAAVEMRVLVREDVGLDVAEGSVGLMLDAVIEGLDDILLEVVGAGMGVDNLFSFGIAVFGVSQSEHSTPAVTRATTGCMCCGMPGVVCSAMAVQTRSMTNRTTRDGSSIRKATKKPASAGFLLTVANVGKRLHTRNWCQKRTRKRLLSM